MDSPETSVTFGTQDTGQINVKQIEEVIKNEQSRDTGNFGYTIHRTNKLKKNRRGNQE